jgi:CheY-like chemotaxis protein
MALVLVTEDEPLVREFARGVILEAGHDALGAASLDEALEIIVSEHHVEILFTDINLRPVYHGGLELARRAMELRPMLRVIYTSGMALNEKLRSRFVAGATFLPKPYAPDGLSRLLCDIA